jgi:lipopolysaccharide heptosyltransferase II
MIDWCMKKSRLISVLPNLFVYQPITLLHDHLSQHVPAINMLNRKMLSLQLSAVINGLGMKRSNLITWISDPIQGDYMGLMNERVCIYDCYDDYFTYSNRNPLRSITRLMLQEERILKRADIVFVVSEELRKKKVKFSKNVYTVSNAADVALLSKACDLSTLMHSAISQISNPIIGMIGNLHQRVDFSLLRYIAVSHPEWSVVIVGDWSGADPKLIKSDLIKQLKSMANVYWLGHQRFDELPKILRGFDVCIIPYAVEDPFNKSCSPLKMYEYLATGKPIVSTDLPSVRTESEVIRIGRSYPEFVREIAAALDEQGDFLKEKRMAMARKNSWDNRAQKIMSIIEETMCRNELAKARVGMARQNDLNLRAQEKTERINANIEQKTRNAINCHDEKAILILALQGIGNTLLAFPMIKELRTHFPKCHITAVVADKGVYELLHANKDVTRVVLTDLVPRNLFKTIKRIRDNKYDIAIATFPPGLRNDFLMLFVRSEIKIGVSDERRIGRLTAYVYNRKNRPSYRMHDKDENLSLIRYLGLETNYSSAPILDVSEADNQYASKYLEANNVDQNELLIGMQPGSGNNMLCKRWPVENFAKLADILISKYKAKIIFFGGGDNKTLLSSIVSLMMRKPLIICGEKLLRTSAIIEKCNIFISNDSGLAHIAAAVGVPVVSMFGATNPARTGPCGKDVIIVKNNAPCAPCHTFKTARLNNCPIKTNICMKSISVENVLDAIEDQMGIAA